MTRPRYDPVKAHQYYEEHKQLKGRHPGVNQTLNRVGGDRIRNGPAPHKTTSKEVQAKAKARVVRLTAHLHKLQAALTAAQAELHKKEAEASKALKTPAQKRQESKANYQKNRTKILQKQKQARSTKSSNSSAGSKASGSSGSSSSSSSSSSTPKGISSMSTSELKDRISHIRSLITSAHAQIKAASALVHSILLDDHHLVHDGTDGRYHTLEGDSQNGTRF